MKIVLISDCHNQYPNIKFRGDEDMIIHAGDMTSSGRTHEIKNFITWFSSLPVANKITISGNHDFGMERWSAHEYLNRFGKTALADFYDHKITDLDDSSIMIDGIEIYGSPWSPEFNDWAFMQKRGDESKKRWSLIPETADIVITHTPMAYHLDRTAHGDNPGCYDLYERLTSFPRRTLHVCGHIHEGYGMKSVTDNLFTVNASILNENYKLVNLPIVFEFDKNKDSIERSDFYYLDIE